MYAGAPAVLCRIVRRRAVGSHPPQETAAERYARPKRILDVGMVLVAAPIATPALLIAGLCTRLSGSTVLFRQTRTGRDLQPFVLLKLCTMRPRSAEEWAPVTTMRDARITPLGRVLRRFKIDELPQLWNVLRGDMAIVGPRPEVPECVAALPDQFRRALVVRPGLTGLTSLIFLDEARRLSASSDVKASYVRSVLPEKIALDLLYVAHACLRVDLRLIALTAVAVVAPGRAMRRARLLADELAGGGPPTALTSVDSRLRSAV